MHETDNPKLRLLAIVRSDTSMQYLWAQYASKKAQKPGDEDAISDLPALAALEIDPFEKSTTERGKSLLAAWQTISSVDKWDAQTLEALLIVLIRTVPDENAPTPPSRSFATPILPQPIRPTAAHPRAYQGTIYKPPKDKSPQPVDLRPYLSDRQSIAEILHTLAPHWDVAVASLARQGYRKFNAVSPDCDPYAAWNHDSRQEILTPALDTCFRSTLLPIVRGYSWKSVQKLHAIFHRLRLQNHPELLANIASMLANSTKLAPALSWCEIISQLPYDQWIGFTALLLQTAACRVDPKTLPTDFLDMLFEIGSGRAPAYRTYCLLRGVARGIECQYLLDGFRLNDRLYPNGTRSFQHSFDEVEASGSFPAEAVEEIIIHLEDWRPFEEWHVYHAWQACAKLEGLGILLAERNWTQWHQVVCQALLRLVISPFFDDNPDDIPVKWALIRNGIADIETALHSIPPEYRWKFCDSLQTFIWRSEVRGMTARSIPIACAALSRICRAPFQLHRNTAHVWVDFISHLSADQINCFLNAPDSSFIQLEKSCRVTNHANHIGMGTWAIAKVAPAFILASFIHAPSRLFRTARTLGCLPHPEGLRLAADVMRLPVMQVDTELLDDADAYAFIESQSQHLERSPIPDALCGHYRGTAPLNTPRLTHYHNAMRQEWQRALLKQLEDMIFDRLALGLAPSELDDSTRHALQIKPGTQENRRPLNKFLAAYWGGRKDYVREHILTQNWLKAHPSLNVDQWTEGIPYTKALPNGEQITISLERNPLEALKLGTHAGSCLGLGGILEYSAAATVLDINKQVLFARDSRGTVIGRQVVAYSEEGEMVCFSIYPWKVDNDLSPLFAEYDRLFAAALNIPVFEQLRPQDGEERKYKIVLILSNGWWDDGYWERETENFVST